MFHKVDPKQSLPKLEEEILKYWEEHKIFEKSLVQTADKPRYSFYDGPPFATGTPHYGHIVASTMKDAVPRYWTMRGYHVPRQWGWDCHGLPIENIAEKELGLTRKKDIETMGVVKFNEFCRSKVLGYVDEWKKVIRRLGRWADMEHAYKTMDRDYMESVWWAFKDLWDKGLIYESYRSMHICPRCETTLSQSEVAEGYKDVKDLAVTVKFELVNEPGTFILAWTTTPWTLPGNVALAVNKDIEYVKIAKLKTSAVDEIITSGKSKVDEYYYIAKSIFLKETEVPSRGVYTWVNSHVELGHFEIVETIKGSEFVGKSYKPLFDYYAKDKSLPNRENGWKIYHADFVTTDMGTGIAHEAPAFGEEDMELAKKENLPWIQHVAMDGTMKSEVTDFVEKPVKPREDPQVMDVEIIKYLAKKNLLFAKEKYEHSSPHCWRCDTPLLNYAMSSWFVKVLEIKPRMLKLAEKINWSPAHIKEGRFGKWLEGARDWSISRQRYWASVLPIWKCEQCEALRVFGSVLELEEASGQTVSDLHKHIVDEITLPCNKCSGTMKRVPDVLDTWFDSGSMPYASAHYPFEHKEEFDAGFPAQFIAEGVDQTRAWFYYLHVLGTALKDKPVFHNVIVNGIVQAEDGKKMSKRLNNYPDPMAMFDKYGADAMRLYFLSSPVVAAENINFSEKEMAELSRGLFRMLWNSYSFFVMYASLDNWKPTTHHLQSANLLDRWILSELQMLIRAVNEAMEAYDLQKVARSFTPFVDNLSNWYIRRSRKRFWKSEDDNDKNAAYATLHHVLVTLSKLMAPFTPFLAEEMYRNLTNEESVHLAEYPVESELFIDSPLNVQMQRARAAVTLGLQIRASNKIKVRQPLQTLYVINLKTQEEIDEIIKDELNVKEVRFIEKQEQTTGQVVWNSLGEILVGLNIEITSDLKLEGNARELIRFIQELRKEAGYEVSDRIILSYQGGEDIFKAHGEMIAREVLAEEVKQGILENSDITKTLNADGQDVAIHLKRI